MTSDSTAPLKAHLPSIPTDQLPVIQEFKMLSYVVVDWDSGECTNYWLSEEFLGYLVGTDGSVWSMWSDYDDDGRRVATSTWQKLPTERRQVVRRCRGEIDGYAHVYIKNKRVAIHKLVMRTFVGETPNGMVIRHYNDVKSDGRLCNLRFGTHAENMSDALRNRKERIVSGEQEKKKTKEDRAIYDREIYKRKNWPGRKES